MKTTYKKIIILADISGMGLDYHVGDEAMAEVAITRLAELVGKHNLVIACASPAEASATYNIKAIPLYSRSFKQRLTAIIKQPLSTLREFALLLFHLSSCDLVFVAGGGNHTSVWPEVLETRLFVYRLARIFKKRLVFASQTLGPYSDSHKMACQRAFSEAKWVGVRDKDYSASQLDIPVHFAVDDAVFLQMHPDNQTQLIVKNNNALVGLSLRGFRGVTAEQQEKLCQAIARITAKNNETCVFIPHHAPGGIHGDLEIARRVSSIWPDHNKLEILDPIPYASAVKELTSHCKWVVTMRYHQLIFSLSVGVPSVGIYVDEYTKAKLNGAFEQFNIKPILVSLRESPERIEQLIGSALSLKEQFIHAKNETMRNALEQNMKPYHVVNELLHSATSN